MYGECINTLGKDRFIIDSLLYIDISHIFLLAAVGAAKFSGQGIVAFFGLFLPLIWNWRKTQAYVDR